MKSQSCCFTGHREILPLEAPLIKQQLEKEITELIKRGITDFYAGGALGFDTLAALTVLDLKKRHPQIRLLLILPCESQARGWETKDKEIYNAIIDQADSVEVLSRVYYNGCMHVRNRRLVDEASVCLCYLRRPLGGTAYTVKYAESQNLEIIRL